MKVEYISHLGTDNTIVDAARVSFNKQASNYTDEQNARLISYLARHNHFTPFTHPQITMRETVPIFVARQRYKHQIGFTYNEVSRRYVDDTPEFFQPEAWRNRPEGSVKQGSGNNIHPNQLQWNTAYQGLLDRAEGVYREMISSGVAPEQVRMVLPQSMYTSYWVTGSLAAWARGYKQRSDSHSQQEIQQLASQWDQIIRPLFPISWETLTK